MTEIKKKDQRRGLIRNVKGNGRAEGMGYRRLRWERETRRRRREGQEGKG